MKREIIVSWIIILFFGLALAPSIYANNTNHSNNEEYVEITAEMVGINGTPSSSVKLTVEQAEELEEVMEEIRIRLQSKEAREKPYEFLLWGFSELNKFGLFQDGFDDKYIQEMFRLWRINTKIMKFLDRFNFDNKGLVSDPDSLSNRFCIVEAEATETYLRILKAIRLTIRYNIKYKIMEILDINKPINIFSLFNIVTFGRTVRWGPGGVERTHFPSTGWVATNGLYGNDSIEGDFYGNLGGTCLYAVWEYVWEGISGFNGFMIWDPAKSTLHHFGFAREILLGREPLE